MLKIKLLGKTAVEYNGLNVTEKLGTKTIALLSMLLLNPEVSVDREKLIYHLWPDSNEDAGKYNLRFNLWLIKSVIGPDENSNSFLLSQRGFCGINPLYNYDCDFVQIKQNSDFKALELARLEFLRSQFTGDFLEGFYLKNCNEFNEIVLMERNYLDHIKTDLLLNLVDYYEKEKAYDMCRQILTQLGQFQPYNEEIALKTMDICELAGSQSEAVIFYKNFKNRLMNSLDINPCPALQNKFLKLRSMSTQENIAPKNPSSSNCFISSKPKPYKALNLHACPYKGITYYALFSLLDNLIIALGSDAISEILDTDSVNFLALLNPKIKLAKTFQNSMNLPKEILELNIATSIFKLFAALKSKYEVSIEISNAENLDSFSEAVLKKLQ